MYIQVFIKKYILALILINFIGNSIAQVHNNITILENKIKTAKVDTTKFKFMGELIYALLPNYPEKAQVELFKTIKLVEKNNSKKLQAQMYVIATTVYITLNNIDSALIFANKSLKLAKDNNLKEIEALNYNNISKCNLRLGKIYESLDYQNRSLSINLSLKNMKNISKDYTNLAGIYLAIPDYIRALEYNLKAIPILEKDRNYDLLWCTYIQQCVIYNRINNYSKAIEMGEKSLKVGFINNFKADIANSYKELGSVYMTMFEKNLTTNLSLSQIKQKSFKYFFQSKLIFNTLNLENELSTVNDYIGTLHLFDNKLDSALYYFNEELKLETKFNNPYGICATNVSIGDVYLKKNNLVLAEQFLLKGLRIAEENNFLDYASDASDNLHALYVKKGDQNKALFYFKQYITYKDSILNDEKRQSLFETQMTYNLDKKRVLDSLTFAKDKVFTTAVIKGERNQKLFYGVLAILSLIGVSVVFYQYKIKKKLNTELINVNQKVNSQNNTLKNLNLELIQSEESLLEANNNQNQLISMMSHDLLNPITAITNYNKQILNSNVSNIDLKEAFKNVNEAIQPMQSLLDNVLQWSAIKTKGIKKSISNVNISNVVQDIVAIYLPQARLKQINLINTIKPNLMLTTDKAIIALIIRNILNNAIKYSNNETTITLTFLQNSIQIIDQGFGIKKETLDSLNTGDLSKLVTIGSGLGLKLCFEFAKSIGLKLHFLENEFKGTTVTISF